MAAVCVGLEVVLLVAKGDVMARAGRLLISDGVSGMVPGGCGNMNGNGIWKMMGKDLENIGGCDCGSRLVEDGASWL